ncbi:MAG TPA: XRE family transcriptional regulator [Pseudonocardiaceae bacterium]
MAEPNDQLRRARERVESPSASGDCLSRQELAELVNAWVYEHSGLMSELDANYVGKLEQGTIRWMRYPERRAAFRAVLGVTSDAELGLRRPRRSPVTLVGVDRQQFIRVGLGIGAGAVAGPAAFIALLPEQATTRIPSVVGMSQVNEVRAAAEAFRGWDARYGGGLMRQAAVAQLRHCAELLNARSSETVRRELLTAVGSFAEITGYMAEDDYAHDDALRMFRFGLACAEEAENWHLRADVLSSMAYQASCAGNEDTALAYTESALVRTNRLTATERAMLHNGHARDLAKLGQTQDALRAVGTADEEFSDASPGDDPPWMASYTESRHLGFSGSVLWELGMHGHYVDETRDRLTTAIDTRAEGRARTRSRIKLARLIMANDDPREAAALGSQALEAAGPLRSRRAIDDLRDLRRLAEPHAHLAEVADLRHRIGAAVAV